MRIVGCEHPKTLVSPYTSELITVPCGKCDTCLNSKGLRWVNKLDIEARRHKYTFMVTLTYDDDNLPRLGLNDSMDSLVFMNRDADYCIPLSEIMDFDSPYMHDEYGEWLDHEVAYLRDRLLHPLGLPCCYNRDFQLFNKRFNKYCFKHVTKEYSNFRFFCAFEYGSTTYRSHYHAIYFFDSDGIAKRFNEIVSACWSFGNIDAESVYSDAGRRYVAQYANMHSHLPSFYNHPKFRERVLFSRFPSIGSCEFLDEEVQHIYNELPLERVEWVDTKKAYDNVPVSDAYKCRFFPKISGYSTLSDSDRIRMYGIIKAVPSSTFGEFEESARVCSWLVERGIANKSESLLASFCFDVTKRGSCLSDALWRLYRISSRVCYYASILRTSVSWIVGRIVEFYKLYDYERLKKMYEFQQEYVINHPLQDLVNIYPDFCRLYSHHNVDDLEGLPLYVKYALKSFGYDVSSYRVNDVRKTYDFRQMVSISHKIFKDTHKRHAANRYRDGKLYFRDPKLSNILKDYQKWQIVT